MKKIKQQMIDRSGEEGGGEENWAQGNELIARVLQISIVKSMLRSRGFTSLASTQEF